ncbi:SPOR domain-containing protein [Vreelandella stevensii]|uniref:SPOR domain-containing protein n=1 Tax=Vreelandella stevensii TaxID=502821 RepID=UPI00403AC28E
MKYGKTERISGLVILLAVLAIIVPWLMSDPAPREERPQPTFVIEQPVNVVRQDVPVPEMPASINAPSPLEPLENAEVVDEPIEVVPLEPQTEQAASSAPAETPQQSTPAEAPRSEPAPAPTNDPIAELVAANQNRGSGSSSSGSSGSGPQAQQQGEWAVQVGSFGNAENAQRISDQLTSQGFRVFQRPRDNNLTTVLVGPYGSSDDGEAALALVKERANVQGLLVRVRD